MINKNLLALLKWSLMSLALLVIAIPSVSQAAFPGYMNITGELQGNIQGSVTLAGRENTMEVIGFGHNVSTPYDSSTGIPNGTPQHRPIRVLKDIDKASPLLANALFNNENLTTVAIRFWRPAPSGEESNFYTVELVDAHLVSITPSHSSVIPNSTDLNPEPMREALTFTYRLIIITWEDGGVTAEDPWVEPVQ